MTLVQKICRLLTGTYSYLFWNVFRPCYKFLLRHYRGLHEIEKKALENDIQGFYKCIRTSKTLIQTRIYFEEKIYKEEVLDVGIIEELYNKKKINHTKANVELFVKTYNKLFNIIKSKQRLEDTRIIKFEHSNKEHKKKLVKFWNLMTSNEPLPDIITRRWIDIGFQGEDPGTDFRGAGLLGLENLIYYVETYPEDAMKVYRDSCDPKHQYFFAAAGLYITLEMYHMMNDNYFDSFFCQTNSKEKALAVFNEIYSIVYTMFGKHWIKQPNATMMRFNAIIIEFFPLLKKELHQELMRSIGSACNMKNLV